MGCISFAERRALSSNVNIIHLIASAAGGGLLLLLVVIFAVCFVRRKKMQFQKRFLAQHSLMSGGALIPSESGGTWKPFIALKCSPPHAPTHTHTCIHTRLGALIQAHSHAYTCARAHTHTHIHTHTYTHTHTRTQT